MQRSLSWTGEVIKGSRFFSFSKSVFFEVKLKSNKIKTVNLLDDKRFGNQGGDDFIQISQPQS